MKKETKIILHNLLAYGKELWDTALYIRQNTIDFSIIPLKEAASLLRTFTMILWGPNSAVSYALSQKSDNSIFATFKEP